MNDNEIRNFFHKNQPYTGDQGTFLAELSARMDAARDIKSIHDATLKRYRRVMLITFIAGCLAGICITVFIMLKPISLPQINKDLLYVAIAIIAITLGLLPWKNVTDGLPS